MEKPRTSTSESPSSAIKAAAWSAIASIASGVSPLEPATPAFIEQNNRPVRGKSVGERWIPMIHAGTKVRHKDQRQSDLLPEPAISKTNSARLYESGLGRNVCVPCAECLLVSGH